MSFEWWAWILIAIAIAIAGLAYVIWYSPWSIAKVVNGGIKLKLDKMFLPKLWGYTIVLLSAIPGGTTFGIIWWLNKIATDNFNRASGSQSQTQQ